MIDFLTFAKWFLLVLSTFIEISAFLIKLGQ